MVLDISAMQWSLRRFRHAAGKYIMMYHPLKDKIPIRLVELLLHHFDDYVKVWQCLESIPDMTLIQVGCWFSFTLAGSRHNP